MAMTPATAKSDLLQENCDEIIDNLFLGGINAAMQTKLLIEAGVTAVVCCTREMEFSSADFSPQLEYYRVDVEDISREPIEWFWPEAADFIQSHIVKDEKVFVHCRAGVSRSASTVIAYLIAYQGLTLFEAFILARARRPVVTPNVGFMERLCSFEVEKNGGDPTICMAKYVTWYSGDQTAAIPDVGSGNGQLVSMGFPFSSLRNGGASTGELSVASSGGETPTAASSSSAGGESRGRKRMILAAQKVMLLQRMSHALEGREHKGSIDKDLFPPKTGNHPSLSHVVQNRLDRIRRVLMRHAAQDAGLGYCQGMHYAAALFAAHADSEGEAYSRFQQFSKGMRSMWVGRFAAMDIGVSVMEELRGEFDWYEHFIKFGLDPKLCFAQIWLPMFTTLVPIDVIVDALELLEANGLAGMMAATWAILEYNSPELRKKETQEEVWQFIAGIGKGVDHMSGESLIQAIQSWLPLSREFVGKAKRQQEVDVEKAKQATGGAKASLSPVLSRDGSRISTPHDGKELALVWPILATMLAELAAKEAAAAANVPAITIDEPPEGPSDNIILPLHKGGRPTLDSLGGSGCMTRRASVFFSEQKQELVRAGSWEQTAAATSISPSMGRRRKSCHWAEKE